jgi:hypothetical protein
VRTAAAGALAALGLAGFCSEYEVPFAGGMALSLAGSLLMVAAGFGAGGGPPGRRRSVTLTVVDAGAPLLLVGVALVMARLSFWYVVTSAGAEVAAELAIPEPSRSRVRELLGTVTGSVSAV